MELETSNSSCEKRRETSDCFATKDGEEKKKERRERKEEKCERH